MNKLVRLQLAVAAVCLSACTISSPGSSGTPYIPDINGRSSVTFSGAVNRTTQYGTASNTGAYCARYQSGLTSITLKENGENRKNSAWMLDGVSMSFSRSLRPQDVSELKDGGSAQMFAVVKEFPDDGTFNISKPCSFNAREAGENKLSISFKCEDMMSRSRSLTVTGWIECQVVQQNF